MSFWLDTLTLECRQSVEVIGLNHHLVFIHGEISAGKSSIARLIDYCFGGDLERTPAIESELISVSLVTRISRFEVLIERPARGSSQITVSWASEDEEFSLLAPIDAGPAPIFGNDIYNFSDLMFYLLGHKPMKVKRAKLSPESGLVRLSIRDILWYCYLRQEKIDSSFYNLEDPFKRLKSRDAMRFIVGFYTEKLNELEIELDEIRESRKAKHEAARQLSAVLQELDYGTDAEIEAQVAQLEEALRMERARLQDAKAAYRENTHFVDDLRRTLQEARADLATQESSLLDLRSRIEEHRALRSELVSAKIKAARAVSASQVLAGISFTSCPCCGESVGDDGPADSCTLCGKTPKTDDPSAVKAIESATRDLTARVAELDISIERHLRAYRRQKRNLEIIKARKNELDHRLNHELMEYDSAFVARTREVERSAATIEERIKGLNRIRLITSSINRISDEAFLLASSEERVKQAIDQERLSIVTADECIRDIEREYLRALLASKVPGMNSTDEVEIDRVTWIPWIFQEGQREAKWSFLTIGSGGKKTLVNVCYALAIHRVARRRGLPLPPYLVIDTPMKNIGEEVNADIWHAFYAYLYQMAEEFRDMQFVILDKEYLAPGNSELDIKEIFMSPSNPLISYYRKA